MTPRRHDTVVWTVRMLAALALACGGVSGGRAGGSEGDSADGGTIDDDGGGSEGPTTVDVDGVGVMGVRRLSVYEYDNTLRDLLGDDTRPGAALLPEDARTPFDNAFASQSASRVLVEATETLAREAVARLMERPDDRDAVIGCAGAAATDADCMRELVGRFGRLALRRPLTDAEVEELAALGLDIAADDGFDIGAASVVRALLQDPEFLYRIETGTPVTGPGGDRLFRLDAFQTATRMSYLLWGSTPDAELLDAAAAGELDEADGRRSAAERLLADPRARAHAQRFHAVWLGYERLPHDPEYSASLRAESDALVERVAFDDRAPWTEILLSTETYIDEMLAETYGLPAPQTEWAWVDLAGTDRRGLLSHASFLSVAANALDTSPVKRGKLVRERLMCSPIPPPPPNVDADSPPDGLESECKVDRYTAHRNDPACAACHNLMDPVGFGLENYDRWGGYREYDYVPEEEESNLACPIEGKGELSGVGAFHGPAELAELLVANDLVQGCAVQQLYTYAMGHEVAEQDVPLVETLTASFGSGGRFDELLLELVAAEAFTYRRQEED